MTHKDAIEVLKANYPDTHYEELRDAVDLAITELEKQIPKKPIKNRRNPRYGMGYEYYDWICPICGIWLAPECVRIDKARRRCNCGQAIDWEGVSS